MLHKCSLCCPCRCWNSLNTSCCCNLLRSSRKWICASRSHQARRAVDDYLHCLERGWSTSAKISDFLRRSLQPQTRQRPRNF
ncbi:hypothetical protein HHK36_006059 [Tetracentron sinense]|uniref:Uncharacterized protein n=1 Tax=Tetracentron sinense TaxID=13715 RepID=A0A835DJV5_TETSI|nr:hypothetical protein HHK36_006059 [Tetracentron sinense]